MRAAGILLFRTDPIEVFLGHPGAPFYKHQEMRVWTVPKGIIEADETDEAAALREFEEETSFSLKGELFELGEVKYKSGKRLVVFACEHRGPDFAFASSEFTHTFPNGSRATYPELDRGEWFGIDEANKRIHPVQRPLIERLSDRID